MGIAGRPPSRSRYRSGIRSTAHPRIRLSPHTSAIGPHTLQLNWPASSHANFGAFTYGTTLEDLVDIRRGY